MKEITEKLLEIKDLKQILQKDSPISILGLSDVSKSCIVDTVYDELKKPILLVTYNELQAQKLHKNLKAIKKNAIYIPKKDIVTYEYDAQNMDILYLRIEGLLKLYNNEVEIAVVSIETLMQRVLSKKVMQNSILKLMVANEYNIEEIKEKLVNLGYERYDLVEGKGNFSVRGDILDIGINRKNRCKNRILWRRDREDKIF